MATKQILSQRTVGSLIEVCSDYLVLRTITAAFDLTGIVENTTHQAKNGLQRRALAERHIASLDLTDPRDARKLVSVAEHLLNEAVIQVGPEAMTAPNVQRLINGLKADGYSFRDGIVVATNSTSSLDSLQIVAEHIDAEYIRNQVRRLEASVEADPEAAIGGAKELIESSCKTVLSDHGTTDLDSMDVPKLIKATQQALKLTPEDVPETARGKDSVKRLMGSLSAIAVSIAELRNEYGTGHGKEGRSGRAKARHARLAVGCAATLSTFLLETHVLQQGQRDAAATKADDA